MPKMQYSFGTDVSIFNQPTLYRDLKTQAKLSEGKTHLLALKNIKKTCCKELLRKKNKNVFMKSHLENKTYSLCYTLFKI